MLVIPGHGHHGRLHVHEGRSPGRTGKQIAQGHRARRAVRTAGRGFCRRQGGHFLRVIAVQVVLYRTGERQGARLKPSEEVRCRVGQARHQVVIKGTAAAVLPQRKPLARLRVAQPQAVDIGHILRGKLRGERLFERRHRLRRTCRGVLARLIRAKHPFIRHVRMLQIHDRAVDLRRVDGVALLQKRSVFRQIRRQGAVIAADGQQGAHRPARAPAHGDDAFKIARQRPAVVAQEPDRRLQVDQRHGRLTHGVAPFVMRFAPAAAAGHIDKAVGQVRRRIAARAAQPGMRHLHIARRVVFKDDGRRARRIAAGAPLRVNRAIGKQVCPGHKDGKPLKLWHRCLRRIEHVLQAPAVMRLIQRPCAAALGQLHGLIDDRDFFHFGPPPFSTSLSSAAHAATICSIPRLSTPS